jgi:hypothetical protein
MPGHGAQKRKHADAVTAPTPMDAALSKESK